MMTRSMPPISAHLAERPVPAPPPTMGTPAAAWARNRARMSERECMEPAWRATGEGEKDRIWAKSPLGSCSLACGSRLTRWGFLAVGFWPLLLWLLLCLLAPVSCLLTPLFGGHLRFGLSEQFVEQLLGVVGRRRNSGLHRDGAAHAVEDQLRHRDEHKAPEGHHQGHAVAQRLSERRVSFSRVWSARAREPDSGQLGEYEPDDGQNYRRRPAVNQNPLHYRVHASPSEVAVADAFSCNITRDSPLLCRT